MRSHIYRTAFGNVWSRRRRPDTNPNAYGAVESCPVWPTGWVEIHDDFRDGVDVERLSAA